MGIDPCRGAQGLRKSGTGGVALLPEGFGALLPLAVALPPGTALRLRLAAAEPDNFEVLGRGEGTWTAAGACRLWVPVVEAP